MKRLREFSVLPGFGLTMGLTLLYTSLLVLIPLAGLFVSSAQLGWAGVWAEVTTPRARAAFGLSVGTALAAAGINAVFGSLVAWVLVRYRFPGRRLLDAMVDLPFALPTAVSGIALTTLLVKDGWFGRYLVPLGIDVAFTRLGVLVALVFIGIPFVVRTVQPSIQLLTVETEEAAATLGAGRWTTIRSVVIPDILPAILTGFALSFARAVGEYGSVIFIAGNMPMRTEIVPLLIVIQLEQYNYAAATALGASMLVISFVILLSINLLQRWGARRGAPGAR